MAIQTVNTYAFNVRRVSLHGPVAAGSGRYMGEQVYVTAKDLPTAIAVLQAQYGTDLGPYSGGGQLVTGALTTMTGS